MEYKNLSNIGLQNLPGWFHGPLGRLDAEAMLKAHGHVDGLFLIRESSSNGFVLSQSYNNGKFFEVNHSLILVDADNLLRLDLVNPDLG